MTTTDEEVKTFKVLLIGNSGVGKSSILLRFTDDEFAEDQAVTIGEYLRFYNSGFLALHSSRIIT